MLSGAFHAVAAGLENEIDTTGASSVLGILFKALKLYRNAHYERGYAAYSNGALYKIALNRPQDLDDLLTLLGDRPEYRETGRELVEVVRLFTPSRTEDNRNARARAQLELVEVKLYDLVVKELKTQFQEDWWFRGVPEPVRIRAAQLYEESEGAIAKESALYLVDLKEIIRTHWSAFKERLADPQESKRSFETRFGYLTDLRNRLSHPVRLKEQPVESEELELLAEWTSWLEEE